MVDSVVQSHAEIVVGSDEKKLIRVLHVADELGLLKVAKQYLELEGMFQVDSVGSVEEALAKLQKEQYDVVVSDYQMPGKDGLEFLKELRARGNDMPFILFTGKGREEVIIKALNLGADHYVNENGDPETVYAELKHALSETARIRKAESELQESQMRYRNLIEDAPDVVYTISENGTLASLNPAFERLTGWKRSEWIGKSFASLIHPDDLNTAMETFEKTLHGECLPPYELRVRSKSGEYLVGEFTSRPWSEKGKIVGELGIVRDVTGRKKAEEELRQSEEKFKILFNEAMDAIFLADADTGIILDCNRAATELVGREKSGLIGKHQRILHPPEKIKGEFSTTFKQHLKEKEGQVLETQVITENGEIKDVAIKANLFELQGKKMLQGIFRDITERKKAEKAIRESQQKFEALFRGNPEAAVYVDLDFGILDVNPRFCQLFGYPPEEVMGKKLNEVIVPEDLLEEAERLDRDAKKGYARRETIRKRKDGSLVPVSISAATVAFDDKLLGYVGTYKDITDLKKLEEKLRVAGSLTRHDVRNKLSAVTGNAYLLRRTLAGNAEALEHLADMENAVRNAETIFEFAGTYEKLGVEQLANMNVGKAVDEAASLFTDLKGVKIVNECHGLTVLADSLLRQLFYNLIDNTLKYGEKTGQIRIYSKTPSADKLELVYEDDGVGIPNDIRSSLFKEGFTSGKGTGYGLLMMKRICEVYGWTIRETGKQGKGAQFTINIPKTKPD